MAAGKVGWILLVVCFAPGFQAISGARVTRHHRVKRSVIGDALTETQPARNTYDIALISDLDLRSKVSKARGDSWMSFFKTGKLTLHYKPESAEEAHVTIEWEEGTPEILTGTYSFSGRGMELSELINFNNKLYTCDDRTGIVYRVVEKMAQNRKRRQWRLVPWVILAGSDGNATNGFKCEWATVKDGNLWIGSHGTTKDYSWVKEITPAGEVTHHNWRDRYKAMAVAAGAGEQGYLTHEAVGWSDYHKMWVFIPRKLSNTSYDYFEDTRKGSNKIILADENFKDIVLNGVAGELLPTHGVSSFKWLPHTGTNHSYIVATKAEEVFDFQATYILAFDMDGKVLFPETKIEESKYEGLEFI